MKIEYWHKIQFQCVGRGNHIICQTDQTLIRIRPDLAKPMPQIFQLWLQKAPRLHTVNSIYHICSGCYLGTAFAAAENYNYLP